MVSRKRSSSKQNETAQSNVAAEAKNDMRSVEQTEPKLEELNDLETELGMEEVDLDQAVIDTVANDDIDDVENIDADEVYDELEDKEVIDDRPQSLTESHGTGLQGKPSDRAGRFSRRDAHTTNEPEFVLTGGDVDANTDDADAVGEEAVGGTVATPDQDTIEELAAAVGIQTDDRSFLRTNDMLEQRDDRRWELDPESAEDYENRE